MFHIRFEQRFELMFKTFAKFYKNNYLEYNFCLSDVAKTPIDDSDTCESLGLLNTTLHIVVTRLVLSRGPEPSIKRVIELNEPKKITIFLQGDDGSRLPIVIGTDDKMSTVKIFLTKKFTTPLDQIELRTMDNTIIKDDDTPNLLQLEHGHSIKPLILNPK